MEIRKIEKKMWNQLKEIYLEAFPKSERKPFFLLKCAQRKGKIQIHTAIEKEKLCGFIITVHYKDLVMVDYLAVSSTIRSNGTGSKLLNYICNHYKDKRILLLIEKLDDNAENSMQRIARKKFYLKNGFKSAFLFVNIGTGCMEILNYGNSISAEDYLDIQRYSLGRLLFKFAKVSVE